MLPVCSMLVRERERFVGKSLILVQISMKEKADRDDVKWQNYRPYLVCTSGQGRPSGSRAQTRKAGLVFSLELGGSVRSLHPHARLICEHGADCSPPFPPHPRLPFLRIVEGMVPVPTPAETEMPANMPVSLPGDAPPSGLSFSFSFSFSYTFDMDDDGESSHAPSLPASRRNIFL